MYLKWAIMSSVNETDLNNLMLSRMSIDDYKRLYNPDLLGFKIYKNLMETLLIITQRQRQHRIIQNKAAVKV